MGGVRKPLIGVLRDPQQIGDLKGGEFAGAMSEKGQRRGLHSLQVFSVGSISEIVFEDLFLGQKKFELHRPQCFDRLRGEGPGPWFEHFNKLHGDGAGPAYDLAGGYIVICGAADGDRVNAVVPIKPFVLICNEGLNEMGVHVVQRDPDAPLVVRA